MEVKEIWKAIPGYEYMYEVSNLGNVKSLSRENYSGKGMKMSKERIRSLTKDSKGYLQLSLCKEGKLKTFKVHKLVVMAFMGHIPNGKMDFVVDHINNVKTDNRLENLQIITNRENISKDVKNKTSKYTGVYWCNTYQKWKAQIQINKKLNSLGSFKSEYDAHLAYQNKLKSI